MKKLSVQTITYALGDVQQVLYYLIHEVVDNMMKNEKTCKLEHCPHKHFTRQRLGTAIGADTIAREEGNKVRREVFTTMAHTDRKQLRNMKKISNITEELRKTVREHTVELAMSRAADYLELEAEKIIGTLHSLLTPSGTWQLGDRHTSDYAMILQKALLKNYRGLNAQQMEEVRMMMAGTTIIATLLSPIKEGSKFCTNMQVLKTLIVPIFDPTSMMVHHRRDDGLWESNEGELRHFSTTGFFSGFSKLDGIEARMVGRTCTIKEGIKMAQTQDLDFLHERFAITGPSHKLHPQMP